MESAFEPVVRTEETSEAHIVEIDVPGYRREDLKVQVNKRGSLIISGERVVKETDEMTTVGGTSEKIQRGGHRFRKVIDVPKNLNLQGIAAKFKDERLRVSLPLLHIPDQQNQDAVPGNGKRYESIRPKEERSNPVGQQDSMQERPAMDDQSARHPEAIRQDDDKEKPTVAAEESKELLEEKKADAPKQDEDLAGKPPISTHAQAVSEETGSELRSESIQSKWKQDDETLLQEDRGQKSRNGSECRHPPQEKKKEASTDDAKPAEKSDHIVGKEENGDGIANIIRRQLQGKKDDKSCLPWRTNQFPDLKRIHFPASCSSTFSKRGVLIASTALVLSVGLYVTYRSRSRHHI